MRVPRSLWGPFFACLAVPSGAVLRAETKAGPAQVSPSDGIRIPGSRNAQAARKAIQGAMRRLADPQCRRVLADFTDASGRRLDRVLEESGQTAESQLALLFFYDGSVHRRCRDSDTLAFTTPGSRVVFICGWQFTQEQRGDPLGTEAIVIHEMLHSLGLGENPPSAYQITSRVLRHCAPETRSRSR